MSTARVMSNNYKRATLGSNSNTATTSRQSSSLHSNLKSSTLYTSNSHLKSSTSKLNLSPHTTTTPTFNKKASPSATTTKSTSMTNLSHATITRSSKQPTATTRGNMAQSRHISNLNLNNSNASNVINQINKMATNGGKKLSHIPTPKPTNQANKSALNGNNGPSATSTTITKLPFRVPTDRTSMINKLRALQEQIDRQELERERLTGELERVSSDKEEQINQLKSELHEKLCEHEKQNEQYHQKLLEAYEMADQSRKAADHALVEARQHDDESRKKIEELEAQLDEVREFMAHKEQMTARLRQLEEQIKDEKDKYEGQVRNLHEMVEKEKIRLEMDVIRKVREVGQNYELNSYKTFSQHVQLDAKLALEKYHKARIIINRMEQQNQRLIIDLKRAQSTLNEKTKRLLMTEELFQQMLQQFQRKLQRNTQNRKFKSQSTQAGHIPDNSNTNATSTIVQDVLGVGPGDERKSSLSLGPPTKQQQKCKLFLVDHEQLEHLRRHNKTFGPIRLIDDGMRSFNRSHHSKQHHSHKNKKILVRYDLPLTRNTGRPIPVGWMGVTHQPGQSVFGTGEESSTLTASKLVHK